MFGVTCTCSWLELFVVIWSWVKNDAAPFLGVGGLVGGYDICPYSNPFLFRHIRRLTNYIIKNWVIQNRFIHIRKIGMWTFGMQIIQMLKIGMWAFRMLFIHMRKIGMWQKTMQ